LPIRPPGHRRVEEVENLDEEREELSEEELEDVDAEELPDREVMSTINPGVDGVVSIAPVPPTFEE